MIELRINGEVRRVEADADATAIFVLRNELGLKSPRLGCGLEQCGACAVLVDGEPVMTCARPVSDFEGKAVETVESLASPVQSALLAANASQCGYCLSGIIVAAEALFRREPAPTREQIVEALDPHLCRCGAHPRILRALAGLASANAGSA